MIVRCLLNVFYLSSLVCVYVVLISLFWLVLNSVVVLVVGSEFVFLRWLVIVVIMVFMWLVSSWCCVVLFCMLLIECVVELKLVIFWFRVFRLEWFRVVIVCWLV